MGINDFSFLSRLLSTGSFSELVAVAKQMMADGASHEELVACPKVVKLGIDSSYMRIKLRCRYLPKIVERMLESSPHLVERVLENSDELVAEHVAEYMAASTKAMLDNGVYQIYYFLEGESHLPKICLAKRQARKKKAIDSFEDQKEQYVNDIQGLKPQQSADETQTQTHSDAVSLTGSDPVEDDGASFEEDQQIQAVPLKRHEKAAIARIAQQYTAASMETAADRVKMVEHLAKLAEQYPNRLFIVSSQHEAELDAAFFYHIGLINMLFTIDTDVLVYGVPTIVTDIMTNAADAKPYEMKYRHFDGFRSNDYVFNAKWERVAIAVMLGCDYNKRIPEIGRVRTCNKIEAVRKKMAVVYASLLAGEENTHVFATWIKTIDAKIGHEPLTFTCQQYAELAFECPSIAHIFAQVLAKMVAIELINEKHMNIENWENLAFAKCFVGLMHPTIMAYEYRQSEEKRKIAHDSINLYKTKGFSRRYSYSHK